MTRIIEEFEVISIRGGKRFKCACGRRVKRVKKFFQTINPWNKKANGDLKSYDDIMPEIRAELKKWAVEVNPCYHKSKNTDVK